MVLTPEIAAGILTAVKEEDWMICGMTYFQICLYFLFYSFGGWVVEVIFHAVTLGNNKTKNSCRCYVCMRSSIGTIDLVMRYLGKDFPSACQIGRAHV